MVTELLVGCAVFNVCLVLHTYISHRVAVKHEAKLYALDSSNKRHQAELEEKYLSTILSLTKQIKAENPLQAVQADTAEKAQDIQLKALEYWQKKIHSQPEPEDTKLKQIKTPDGRFLNLIDCY